MADAQTFFSQMEAATGDKGVLGSVGKALKGKAGVSMSAILAPLLVQMIAGKAGGVYSRYAGTKLQKEAIQTQKQSLDPDDLFIQALMPSLESAKQQAQEALLAELGMPTQTLAAGERMIGG